MTSEKKGSKFPTNLRKQNFKKKKNTPNKKENIQKGGKFRQTKFQRSQKCKRKGQQIESNTKSVINVESIYLVQCSRKNKSL